MGDLFMKIPVSRKRTLITFFVADLIFAVLIFFSCFSLFVLQEWGIIQIIVIVIFIAISIAMLVLSLTRNFYVIEDKFLVSVKGYKEMYYNYKDVVYIDKKQSEKKKVLCFYTNKGHVRYLAFDKNGEIYKAMCDKCHNLLNDEEFHSKYPNVKI